MRIEGLIFLIIGIALCIIGMVYNTDWIVASAWIGGLFMILISVVIMFPQKKGVNIE